MFELVQVHQWAPVTTPYSSFNGAHLTACSLPTQGDPVERALSPRVHLCTALAVPLYTFTTA